MYTDGFTCVYNCQPQTSTAKAPFAIVLSRSPPPTATKAKYSELQSAKEFKRKWKAGIQKYWRMPEKDCSKHKKAIRKIKMTEFVGKNDHQTRALFSPSGRTEGRQKIQTQTVTHRRRSIPR